MFQQTRTQQQMQWRACAAAAPAECVCAVAWTGCLNMRNLLLCCRQHVDSPQTCFKLLTSCCGDCGCCCSCSPVHKEVGVAEGQLGWQPRGRRDTQVVKLVLGRVRATQEEQGRGEGRKSAREVHVCCCWSNALDHRRCMHAVCGMLSSLPGELPPAGSPQEGRSPRPGAARTPPLQQPGGTCRAAAAPCHARLLYLPGLPAASLDTCGASGATPCSSSRLPAAAATDSWCRAPSAAAQALARLSAVKGRLSLRTGVSTDDGKRIQHVRGELQE
jgi:hypothetical protein